ncbi:hypothetical protein PR003_g783 [Phytophthora rubi]|uniref:SprT-like domain-containing protein n=1 Tax=Phytophthora rubi TaxID=129364 RepID=A0A6A3NY93_9STRA|nr:hypothetical protein PR002_g605 [Phytophthora rubi]KAE9052427.1 hypothetical protein PR001_g546 [Phytophthora rubi]KAE9359378.1 hypothetical protein PR003_g783 [Phytophthora rubi]
MANMMAHAVATARGDTLFTQQCDLLAPENEYLDPNPDLHSLFQEYNRMFFEGRLAGCEVKWSKRMTLCAGLCSFQPRSGFCSIRLSEPLLKLRPRSDMVNTLLHEMVHAYVFVATPVRDHEDHGPLFQAHMNRINQAAKTQITVFHTFHDEVDSYRQHVWQCNGPCRHTRPYFGLVKRAMNRAPGPTDRWWADHERSCGGSYTKIKEPAEFTAKQAKKKERELAREQKQKKKDKETKAAPSVKQFFPTMKEDTKADQSNEPAHDTKPPSTKKKMPKSEVDNGGNKKRKIEKGGDSSKEPGWPLLDVPSSGPVIISAGGDEDEYFLVGDIQALFQTQSTNQFDTTSSVSGSRDRQALELRGGQITNGATIGEVSTVVDLTASGSDVSDSEDTRSRNRLSSATLPQAAFQTQTTANQDVIEID